VLVALAVVAAAVAIPLAASGSSIPSNLKRVSQDGLVDQMGSGRSELQSSVATAPGSKTVVAAFEVHRVFDGGSSAIGWATSINGGGGWSHGLLPLTIEAGGPSSGSIFPVWRGADPSAAYDASHGKWLVAARALGSAGTTLGLTVNSSADGTSWAPPVVAHQAGSGDSPGKPSLTCDNWATSSGYGDCYLVYPNTSSSPANQLQALVSTDGGQTWSAPAGPSDLSTGTAPSAIVQPPTANATCARVVVAYANGTSIDDFDSADCGATWNAHSVVTSTLAAQHTVAQGLRSPLTPSLTIDGNGALYLVWQTRSFRIAQTALAAAANAGDTNVKVASVTGMVAGNTLTIDSGAAAETVTITTVGTAGATGTGVTITPALASAHASGALVTVNGAASTSTASPNDIALSVMQAPTVATPEPSFGAPSRVSIETDAGAVSNTVDHFIPSVAADPKTFGSSAHLALFYYFYPVASCSYLVDVSPGPQQCQPQFGFVSSTNGGSSWSAAETVASMPSLAVLVRSNNGPDLGAYTSSFIPTTGNFAGRAFSVFALGLQTSGLDESMYVPLGGLAVGGGS
jgi:hypothetical protein